MDLGYVNLYEVEDFMEVSDGLNGGQKTLSFTVQGEPPIQKRHRFAWHRVLQRTVAGKRHPIVFDPSAKQKKLYAASVENAMEEFGLTTSLPYFSDQIAEEKGLNLWVHFNLIRPLSHYDQSGNLLPSAPTYPRKKDIDNLLKFLMDAMEKLLYKNDSVIRIIVAKKSYTKHRKPFTKVVIKLH